MLTYTANARDGAPANTAACNTCCCEPIQLRAGETNLVTINYAPWSVPIGWIVPTMDFDIELASSTCSESSVGGFIPPNNSFYSSTGAINAVQTGDLTTSVQPAGNTFTFKKVPVQGPNNGSLTLTPAGAWTYTPNSAFQGYDHFYYVTTDAQGREQTRAVSITVGTPTGSQSSEVFASQPIIAVNTIETNKDMHTVQFAIFMPLVARDCDVYRLTIKQPARNCEGTIFNNLMCFDISTGSC